MNGPSISVAMCTCNGARYLREQLQSIARQTLAADEVVVCDDASSDETPKIIQELAAGSLVRMRLVRNPQTLGCTRNFGLAIGLCEGDIIVLADQDDVWKPEKLAIIAHTFATHPAAGYAFSDADMVSEAGAPLGFSLWETVGFDPRHFAPSQQVEVLLKRNLVTGAAMAFRSWLRGVLLPIPAAWRHDYWIALLGSIFSWGFPIPERLLFYRRHFGQQMGCGKDTLLAKVKTSLSAKPNYYAQAARLAELRERAVSYSQASKFPAAHLQLVREKEVHLSHRALIRSAHGGTRITRLLSEAASGRYQRFSFSWSSMVRDLMAAAPSH
jgi:glycosyltransferase involved in cell wall biosynthesis